MAGYFFPSGIDNYAPLSEPVQINTNNPFAAGLVFCDPMTPYNEEIVQNRNRTLNGGAKFGAQTRGGMGLAFDAVDDYLSYGTGFNLNPLTQPFSAVVVYNAYGSSTFGVPVNNKQLSQDGWAFVSANGAVAGAMAFSFDGVTNSSTRTINITETSRWHAYAFSSTGTTQTFVAQSESGKRYLTTGSTTHGSITGTLDFRIGRRDTLYANGSIGMVAVWIGRAFTEDQLAKLADNPYQILRPTLP